MRARKNETVEGILSSLEGGKSTAEGVSKTLKTSVSKVRTILGRLFKQGNVDREKVQQGVVVIDEDEDVTRPRYVYLYEITDKGKARLSYIAKAIKGQRSRKGR